MTKNFYNIETGLGIVVDDDATIDMFEGYSEVPPPVDLIKMAAEIRAQRNQQLADTDWMCLPDGNPCEELFAYRQALRDVTLHPNFPLELPNIPRYAPYTPKIK